MLNYFREGRESQFATTGRRWYNFLSGAALLVILGLVFMSIAPAWILWIAIPQGIAVDIWLTRKWTREDALKRSSAM
ncbi:hypothetical protein V1639_08895 [Pseudarthrobacter sp. J75]|uniref:hypothetical protein n=1 Tax=unclassified Pseudarthrobacter TaxID=2647000 RepID=UPI002E81A442|nr:MULTISPECIES: hypothetical protein [unclassified Pseudarthrobacter]MEE2522511.1 hypothetical protein [Pseudarthrobacter sp. J47]MEE2529145.1 hypothetical protein [Pseudarthrobacter sp. J75]